MLRAKEELDRYGDEQRRFRTYLMTLPAAILAAAVASYPQYEVLSAWVLVEMVAWILLGWAFVEGDE